MSALDNSPYRTGQFSLSDLHPDYPSWSTRDLSTPETREQLMTEPTVVEQSSTDPNLAQAEKNAGNAGAKTPDENKNHMIIWVLVILALLVFFHF